MVVVMMRRGGDTMKIWKIQKKTIANSLFVLKCETGTLNKDNMKNMRPRPIKS